MSDAAAPSAISPSLRDPSGAATTERIVVGIGDMKIGQGAGNLIMTFALGSCVGLTVWDPQTRVGAMLHAMLPSSRLAQEKAKKHPFMFVDTGVPETFRACYELGIEKHRAECRLAGGACTNANPEKDVFKIGAKNVILLEALLDKNDVRIRGKDVGGCHSRTLMLDLATGMVTIQSGTEVREL